MENNLNFKVLYEDNHVIVVIKPAGIPVQQDKSNDLDMLTMVKHYLEQKYNKDNAYVGLVHRLDRMVAGVMVFAKTSKAASRLSDSIRKKEVEKRYYAILNGNLENQGINVLENYLFKNQRINMSRVVESTKKNAKLAILEYQIIKTFEYNNKIYTLVDIDLKTGRHHQIRVQFQNIGHPLYGDIKYGQKINKVGQKLALFSYYLKFKHPVKNENLEFQFMPWNEESVDKIFNEVKF